jgi:hypothetical protein
VTFSGNLQHHTSSSSLPLSFTGLIPPYKCNLSNCQPTNTLPNSLHETSSHHSNAKSITRLAGSPTSSVQFSTPSGRSNVRGRNLRTRGAVLMRECFAFGPRCVCHNIFMTYRFCYQGFALVIIANCPASKYPGVQCLVVPGFFYGESILF